MRQLIFFLLVVALPTALFGTNSDASSSSYLNGNYYDSYTGTAISITTHRRGISARINNRGWRTFNRRGNGVYDDYNGRVIVRLGNGNIRYVQGNSRNALVLSRRQRGFSQNRSGFNSYGNSRSIRYNVSPYCGSWTSFNSGGRLFIEAHGSGFRARNNRGSWSYYSGHRDGSFRDRSGNRFFFNNRNLIWSSASGRRRTSFRRY